MTPTTHEHGRDSLERRYVYSVLGRRAGGISLGVNLNPDRICNWACAYCQVAREDEPKIRQPVEAEAAAAELTELLESAADGSLLEQPLHRGLPSELRRIVDVVHDALRRALDIGRRVGAGTHQQSLRRQKIEQLAISNLSSNDRYNWLQVIAEIPGPRERCANAINAIMSQLPLLDIDQENGYAHHFARAA